MPPNAPRSHINFRWSMRLIALLVLWTAAPAGAVERTCGPDPVANTANVLCAAPSGPCTEALVVVSANITVRVGGCDFDLGGRALRIERTIRVPGREYGAVQRGMVFHAASDVTITRRAKLKSRGDFVRLEGKIIGGDTIGLEASGRIDVLGTLDSSGAGGGVIYLVGAEGVTFERPSKIRARGISSVGDESEAVGGDLYVESSRAGVLIDGDIDMRGGNQSYGGTVEIVAVNDVEVNGTIDASGGPDGGGTILVVSSDDVRIDGLLTVASRNGGGTGGDIVIAAGEPSSAFTPPDGAKVRGELHIGTGRLDARGSGKLEVDPGSGGTVDLAGVGAVHIGADAVIRADSGSPLPEGSGGFVTIAAGDDLGNGPPTHGDIDLAGLVSTHGSGYGGAVDVTAARDATLTGKVDVTGGESGGGLSAVVGRDLTFNGSVRAAATHAGGQAGQIRGFAGQTADGTLVIATDLRAPAGASGECSRIHMSTCSLSVAPAVTLDASCAAVGEGQDPNVITLLARNAIDLGAASRHLAAPAGRVALVHPPGVVPTIGAGVQFIPTLVDAEDAGAPFPACGVEAAGPAE